MDELTKLRVQLSEANPKIIELEKEVAILSEENKTLAENVSMLDIALQRAEHELDDCRGWG